MNLPKNYNNTINNITKKNSSLINLGSSNMIYNDNNINNKKKETDIINSDNNVRNSLSKKKTNIKVKINYTDCELNILDYKNAILHDKRSCGEYYICLIKEKNIILFSFCPRKDYNSIIIRSCIFSLSFSIYYAINFAFFTDEIIHQIYEDGGKYDIVYFLPKISFSFIISYYITAIIKLIFLSERNIIEVKQQVSLFLAYSISDKVRKNLVIKYIIFFLIGLGFLVFFWMLLSSFGAVYPNTQMFIFKNALISFSMSLVYPFIVYIFPCMFRIGAINSKEKNSEYLYKLSKLLQMF